MSCQPKVDFMILGSQKSGTSSLAFQIRQHPEICFCSSKEPHYFSQVEDWKAKIGQYHELFSPQGRQLCGEASTTYTFPPDHPYAPYAGCVPSRIFEYNPMMKLVYIMRDPVERAVSHYSHRFKRGNIPQPLEIEIFRNSEYIDISRYGSRIAPWIDLFESRILFLIFEEFVSNPQDTLDSIAEFLRIEPNGFQSVDTTPKNQSVDAPHVRKKIRGFLAKDYVQRLLPHIPPSVKRKVKGLLSTTYLTGKPEIPPLLREALWCVFESDVEIVEELLGRRITSWRQV